MTLFQRDDWTLFRNLHTLGQRAGVTQYAHRIKADTESINAIATAKLLLQGRLGQLMQPPAAAERGAMGGRGNKAVPVHGIALSKNTKTLYRKIADNAERIEEYAAAVEQANSEADGDSLEAMEMSSAGFLRFITGERKSVETELTYRDALKLMRAAVVRIRIRERR
jgi:hypothetical protein